MKMTLDSKTTSAAGPSNGPSNGPSSGPRPSNYYSGLPRGHSSPRLDYPYFQPSNNLASLAEHSSGMNITMTAPISMNIVNSSSIMHPAIHHSRSNNHPNINMNFPTTLRSNSWDGQGMFQWGMPPAFHDRHRASQPDLAQSSSMNFQNPFPNNHFNPMNFNQPIYNPSPQLSEMPNPNLPMNFNSTRFSYPDGRSYSLVNHSQHFNYPKPYDKSSPPRPMAMFGEPAFSDRPHLCQIPNCGRMFKRLEHLKRHHRSIHTHERPYPCRYPKCSKAFSRSDNLAQHMRIHRQDPHHDL